jgi:GTP-binding protein
LDVKKLLKHGDICAIIGVEGFEIGDTIADHENQKA